MGKFENAPFDPFDPFDQQLGTDCKKRENEFKSARSEGGSFCTFFKQIFFE